MLELIAEDVPHPECAIITIDNPPARIELIIDEILLDFLARLVVGNRRPLDKEIARARIDELVSRAMEGAAGLRGVADDGRKVRIEKVELQAPARQQMAPDIFERVDLIARRQEMQEGSKRDVDQREPLWECEVEN